MRELKFRIWHEQDKCFIYSEPFDPNIVGGGGYTKDKGYYYHFWPDANIGGELCQIKSCCLTNRPIHQYTGLKDKNGAEIYEGDILNQVLDNKPCYYLVEWGNLSTYCGFGLRAIMKRDGSFKMTIYDFKSYLSEGFEIIGNIFENPELMK